MGWHGACASNSSASVDPRSIPCTRRRSNASARARLIGLTSSASRSPSPPPSATPRAASSSPMGNPYDGHTLATVIPDMEALVGNTLERLLADKGYRGPQRAARLQVQDLHLGPETGRDAQDQTSVAPQVRRRAGDRPSQGRAPHRPQLSLAPSRRRHQRRPGRRRLQLPPSDPLAEHFVASVPQRPPGRASTRPSLTATFFTDDYGKGCGADTAAGRCRESPRVRPIR
jgi:hypothetical protein